MTVNSKILGNVDLISSNVIKGWVLNTTKQELKLKVDVLAGKQVVASGVANLARNDLIEANLGHCAFIIQLPFIESLEPLIVLATDPITDEKLILPSKRAQIYEKNKKSGYQSFDDQIGDSNSFEKLRRLRLPNLSSLSVLDVGCNEGFFCIAAKKMGATRVLGMDIDSNALDRAKLRMTGIDYRQGSWWDAPQEQFDLILFLSAIHYEVRQKELLSFLMNRLTPKGKLILECGVSYKDGKSWIVQKRDDGFQRYPTIKLLVEDLLAGYAVTDMGQSVNQSGDPVSRFVFHCARKQPMYLLITGKSGSGKSILSREIARSTGACYSIDNFFYEIKSGPNDYAKGQPLLDFIKQSCNLMKLDSFIPDLIQKGFAPELVKEIFKRLPTESDFIVIEGEALAHTPIKQELVSMIENYGGVVWGAHRIYS